MSNNQQQPNLSPQDMRRFLDALAAAETAQGNTPTAPLSTPPAKTLMNRDVIDRSLPAAKVALAAFCWINSFVSSVLFGRTIHRLVWVYNHPGATDSPSLWFGGVLGFVLQVILTAGQLWTAERSPRWYRFFLYPDAFMTGIMWAQLIYAIMTALLSVVVPSPFLVLVVSVVVAVYASAWIGVQSAKQPELMVFGHRRSS